MSDTSPALRPDDAAPVGSPVAGGACSGLHTAGAAGDGRGGCSRRRASLRRDGKGVPDPSRALRQPQGGRRPRRDRGVGRGLPLSGPYHQRARTGWSRLLPARSSTSPTSSGSGGSGSMRAGSQGSPRSRPSARTSAGSSSTGRRVRSRSRSTRRSSSSSAATCRRTHSSSSPEVTREALPHSRPRRGPRGRGRSRRLRRLRRQLDHDVHARDPAGGRLQDRRTSSRPGPSSPGSPSRSRSRSSSPTGRRLFTSRRAPGRTPACT